MNVDDVDHAVVGHAHDVGVGGGDHGAADADDDEEE